MLPTALCGPPRQRISPRRSFLSLFSTLLLCALPALAQGDKVFTIPLDSLKSWSQNVLVTMRGVSIRGNSAVHELSADCEIHFGAAVEGYRGDPPGFVLEPMNICLTPFFGKSDYKKTDWTKFAKSLRGKTVQAEGVPRIWPEHLEGDESDSNPNHALELHPLTKLTAGKAYDFSDFVSAPENYRGGVSAATAEKILENTKVGVTASGDSVEVDFDAGRIGNFTAMELRIRKADIKEVGGSHRMEGEVVLSASQAIPVHLVTVRGSKIDERIAKYKAGTGTRPMRFEALVLFSLSPEALMEAAVKSTANRVEVEKPLQLIVYGVPEEE